MNFSLKKAVILFCLKPLLGLTVLNNYLVVYNLLFLGKIVEKVVKLHFQRILDEVVYLDPYQSYFSPSPTMRMTLVALVGELFWD